MADAVCPRAVISSTVSLRASIRRPATTILAPSAASARAMPLPIPLPPPVTIATLPSSFPIEVSCDDSVARVPVRVTLIREHHLEDRHGIEWRPRPFGNIQRARHHHELPAVVLLTDLH